MTTDSTGTFNFYAPDGRYDLVVAVAGFTKTVADVEISDLTETNSGDTPAVLNVKTLNNIRFAEQFPGADLGAKINAADVDLGSKGGSIYVSKAAGTVASTQIVLRNSLRFTDDQVYLINNPILVQTGGITIEGMGLSNANGNNLGTGLQWNGSAGQDILQIQGTTLSRLDKIILRNIWFLGAGSARYGLRCEKADIMSIEDCKFSNCANAGCYMVDCTGQFMKNCDFTNIPAYGLILDWGTGQFTSVGLVFESLTSMTGQFLLIQGSGSGQSFYGTTMQVDGASSWIGFVKVTGFDTNSAFSGAPTGGAGAPVGPGFYNLNLTVVNGGNPSQGADVVVDGTVTNPSQDVIFVQPQFLGNSVSNIALLIDHAKGTKLINGFSNGHTTQTVSVTANASYPQFIGITSLDTILGDSTSLARLAGLNSQASNGRWDITNGLTFGNGTVAIPALAFNADTGTGFSRPGANYWRWSSNATDNTLLSPGGPIIANSKVYGFANGDSFGSSTLTGLSWISQGTIGVGNATAGDTSGNLQFSKITKYNGTNTAGIGAVVTYGSTSQRSETAADTNVLTFAPAASAGTYRLNFSLDVSAQNTATLGWTATWKDSNGSAQAPTNLSLFTSGTAAPALTVTAATNGNYYGSAVIDVDNTATSIVIKLTFAGTSFTAKVSASIERLA